jgi:hypothetical protein
VPRETPAGTADGVNPTFTLSAAPDPDTLILIVDYAWQKPVTNYTLATNTITFLTGSIPQSGAILDAMYGASVGPTGIASTPPWDTADNLINDAALELGLLSSPSADVYASTDPNIVQLRAFLKSGCREIGRLKNWTHLVKQYSFATVTSQANYSLPTDFRQMIDQTQWNRTNSLPLGGPTSSQEWQYLAGRLVGVVFTVLFRPWQGQLYLFPDTDTPGGYTIAFEYLSRYFVKPYGSGTPTTESPSANTDTICFEPYLVVRKLKYDFRRAKKMDYASELADWEAALEQVMGDDSASPTLRLDGGMGMEPLIDGQSVPITDFGS